MPPSEAISDLPLISVSCLGKKDAVVSGLQGFVADGAFRVDAKYFEVAFQAAQLELPVRSEDSVDLLIVVTQTDLDHLPSLAFWRAVQLEVIEDTLIEIRDLHSGDYFRFHWLTPSRVVLLGASARHCFMNDNYVELLANTLVA
ncbi:hypothetical protein EGT07_08155 [Herbaspirillum sp. HC18]|nr:hypothetical protein EGT07_08155 [Herbaspirillum sp. HC18]